MVAQRGVRDARERAADRFPSRLRRSPLPDRLNPYATAHPDPHLFTFLLTLPLSRGQTRIHLQTPRDYHHCPDFASATCVQTIWRSQVSPISALTVIASATTAFCASAHENENAVPRVERRRQCCHHTASRALSHRPIVATPRKLFQIESSPQLSISIVILRWWANYLLHVIRDNNRNR